MNRSLEQFVTAAQRLAVNGDDLGLQIGIKRSDVLDQAALDFSGLDELESVREGLAARHPVGQRDSLLEPTDLKLAEILDLGEAAE